MPENTKPTAKITIIDNKKCSLFIDDKELFDQLYHHLSYKEIGVEYTIAYQNGWNGINFLINRKGYQNGTFSSGLFDRVKKFCQESGVEPEVIDKRAPIVKAKPIDLSEKLLELNMVPRDYQEEIVDVAIANHKGIVRSSTGSGKTLTTAIITAKLNKPTIIYVIGLDLLKQFHDLFSQLFDEPIGYIGDGICKIERINIATIWSIGASLRLTKKQMSSEDEDNDEEALDETKSEKISKMLAEAKVHIFDESHIITTDTIKAIYKSIDPEYIYGFSGTPFRGDNTDLFINSLLGEQIIDVSASRLIKAGYLAQPIIKFITVPKMHIAYTETYPSVYKACVVENDIRNAMIVKQAKLLLDKKYTPLVLFKQIKHGELLFGLFQQAGIKCEMLYGNDKLERRTEVRKMMENKEIDLVLASVIFDIGVSWEMLNALILCGSGKSSVRSLQRIGRVIRMVKGRKHSAVVDFFDQVKFLKKHAQARAETYASEDGFLLYKSKEMK